MTPFPPTQWGVTFDACLKGRAPAACLEAALRRRNTGRTLQDGPLIVTRIAGEYCSVHASRGC